MRRCRSCCTASDTVRRSRRRRVLGRRATSGSGYLQVRRTRARETVCACGFWTNCGGCGARPCRPRQCVFTRRVFEGKSSVRDAAVVLFGRRRGCHTLCAARCRTAPCALQHAPPTDSRTTARRCTTGSWPPVSTLARRSGGRVDEGLAGRGTLDRWRGVAVIGPASCQRSTRAQPRGAPCASGSLRGPRDPRRPR